MPLIATPISHLFHNKDDAIKIQRVSDCLELRQETYDLKFDKEWLFHFDIDLIHPWDDQLKEMIMKYLKNKNELRLITFQATRCYKNILIRDGMFQITGAPLDEKSMLKFAKDNVTWLRENLKNPKIKIGLENNNYFNTGAYEIVTNGFFLTEIIKTNKIFLLLDIAHARITAHNLNINYYEYIKTLPLEKVIQLHICEFSIINNIAYDTHNQPSLKTLIDIKKLFDDNTKPIYITLEYYKDIDKLIDSIKKIKSVLLD